MKQVKQVKNKVGRPELPEGNKKVQVIFYVQKKKAKVFKTKALKLI